MNWEEIRAEARGKLEPVCRVCPVCNGVACAGQVPGMGGPGTGVSFKHNVTALAAYRLVLRTLHSVAEPELGIDLWGRRLSLPVLGAAVAGAKMNMNNFMPEEAFVDALVAGAAAAGTLAMTGDGPLPIFLEAGLAAISRVGAGGIVVIKPRPIEQIVERARRAAAAGAVAVGIDVDAACLVPMKLAGQPVGPLPESAVRELATTVGLPLILKGVMSADEAELAARAGAAGIVVSNHGGRALDHLPGTAEVLPEIAAAVKGKIAVLADGGVRTGGDVLKMLALGADAVLVGRPLVWAAAGGGAEGVETLYRRLADELRTAMVLTGCASPEAAGPRLVRRER